MSKEGMIMKLAKRLRLVVNPQVIEPDLWSGSFRAIPPASQPAYKAPELPNDRITNNYYFQRDTRRNFPQTTIYANPTTPALAAGAAKALPQGPGMNVVPITEAPTVESILADTSALPTPPAIHVHDFQRSTDSNLPTDSPTTYFHVAAYN
ncbi:hypothetical protein AMAG_05601 [Allomyces macrogynus ATCC 38327]|uniref:NADH dehydrogenase [ubiquinone] 1 alpha subcomplex subunit 7 n=1 Tax=Allomyces macrogynus (strain ATCC 38327) TaxID=578462 RepID=A0A0L0SCL7_ALLM3|nr:hypothetical protein AMAG_05601 [Allomyces macrogynus ATCC 38327]|eukprot:KNE60182.1 hypothetical protein AMAG_05601 [Allomyces macrogynus ATCC 38327]